MKVITIKQPWATLIAKGYKEYEFRTWKTKYRGDILIHAGKGIDKKAISRFEDFNLEYPNGCIIAKAKITDCIYVDDKFVSEVVPKNAEVYKGLINKDNWEGYGLKIEDVEEIFKELIYNKKIIPDVVFVDPPRKGLDLNTIDNLLKIKPKKIIYISCNPASLVRDLSMLEKKYDIQKITPVDLFPFTYHICFWKLTRNTLFNFY